VDAYSSREVLTAPAWNILKGRG